MTKDNTSLPITETGYRSHFVAAKDVEEFASPIEYVRAWLTELEKGKKWQGHLKELKKKSQLSLF
jgi:hypothetical protein